MALLTIWRGYKEGQDVPIGFTIFNSILFLTKQYNLLHAQKLLNLPITSSSLQVPEIPSIVFQRLHTAEIGAFVGVHQENASLWINNSGSVKSPFVSQELNLFDTGADQSLVNKKVADLMRLPTDQSNIKRVIMADNRSTPVTNEAKPFPAQIGDVQTTLSGPIIPIPKYDVILGLDWMRKTKPHIDCNSATLTIQPGEVHHHVYPTHLDTLMRDHVFVKIMETEEETDPSKISWNTCT
ncbi:hypothetical protein DSO57_1037831 [Entomophthora muscae]|uniref:Uncharacterized protein n=1 Tax=Entomophthora muscae TaxID=34485 RepID=A0ACC2SYW9_9FUNG|nr:hypothetical protein DSO57_1037831 [Entomophthora muscae]